MMAEPTSSIMTVSGNYIQIKVDAVLLGLGDTFDFKWADNPTTLDNVISLCTHGDTAPNRRFNFRYIWKK